MWYRPICFGALRARVGPECARDILHVACTAERRQYTIQLRYYHRWMRNATLDKLDPWAVRRFMDSF